MLIILQAKLLAFINHAVLLLHNETVTTRFVPDNIYTVHFVT